MLEDELREMFAVQVGPAPVLGDPADAAIRRARGIRRRRGVTTGAATVLVLVMVLGGLMSLREWSRPAVDEPVGRDIAQPDEDVRLEPTAGLLAQRVEPEPGPDLRLVGLDLRVGHQLWTTDGKRLSLTGVGLVTRVYRVPAGWVYGGAEHVRLLRTDGTTVLLHSAGERWLVSPDGQRLAYVDGRKLHMALIVTAGLTLDTSIVVPEGTSPVAFAGDQLIIAAGAAGPFDAVSPTGPYRATWNSGVVAVYGAAGEVVSGLVHDARHEAVCLAAMRPGSTGLTVTRTGGCVAAGTVPRAKSAPTTMGLTEVASSLAGNTGWLAPDGAFLAQPDEGKILLVNLDQTFGGDRVGVACPVATIVAPAWVDGTTVVAADERDLIRCRTDGTSQVLPLPDGLPRDWNFVPKLTEAKPR